MATQHAKQTLPMLQWEYKVWLVDDTSQGKQLADVLQKEGTHGWELVSMAPVGGAYGTLNLTCVFKRPTQLPATPDPEIDYSDWRSMQAAGIRIP